MVRLERINGFYGRRPHSLYLSGLVAYVSSLILRNRELDSARWLGIRSSDQNKLVGEMVEGTPEIMDRVPDGGKGVEGDERNLLEHIWRAYLPSLSITLTDSNVTVLVPKEIKFGYEITEVLLGPIDFRGRISRSSAVNRSVLCTQQLSTIWLALYISTFISPGESTT